jgi:hypothetical protein
MGLAYPPDAPAFRPLKGPKAYPAYINAEQGKTFGSKQGYQVTPAPWQWRTAEGFGQWKTGHEKSPYVFESKDIDGDGIPEAMVWANQGKEALIGINGMRINGSNRRAAREWTNPETSEAQDYYDYYQTANTEYRGAQTKMSDINKQFANAISPLWQQVFYTRELKRAYPLLGIAAALVSHLVKDKLDSDYMTAHGAEMQRQGKSYTSVIASLHRMNSHREAVITALTRLMGTRTFGNDIKALMTQFRSGVQGEGGVGFFRAQA